MLNKIQIIGYLGRDPETHSLPSGDMVAKFSVATTERWKSKDGEKKEQTEWHNVAFFGRQAEVCAKYLTKGSLVYVEGSLQTRKYEKNGETRYATEIKGREMKMLGGGGGGGRQAQPAEPQRSEPPAQAPTPEPASQWDDDIPFN